MRMLCALVVGLLLFAARMTAQAPPTVVDGTLERLVEDYRDRAVIRDFVTTDEGRRLEIKHRGALPPALSGDKIRVTGRLRGSTTLDGAVMEKADATPTLAPGVANTLGPQRTIVILINFQDKLYQPYTVAAAAAVMFPPTNSANSFYLSNTYGQTSIVGDVVGWYTIPIVAGVSCNNSTWAVMADQAATSHGVDLSKYTRRLYGMPKVACSWWGLGSVGGNPSRGWINGQFTPMIVGHEMGHNFGDYHSHSMPCELSGCYPREYGDDRDIMGVIALNHMNPFQKERLGWLNEGNSPPIQTVTASGNYPVEALELAPAGGPKALKILRSTDSAGHRAWYYVDLRAITTQTKPPCQGCAPIITTVYTVELHTGDEGSANSSFEVDVQPTTSTFDSSLDIGQSFSDRTIGLTITTISADATGAVVNVAIQ